MGYEFADRLIELRKAKGMSQEELAQRIGLSRQAVSKWERAESSPDIGNLVALAEIYELTIDEIVKGESAEAVPSEPIEDEVIEIVEEDAPGTESLETPIESPAEILADDPIANMPPPDPSQRVDVESTFTTSTSVADQPASTMPFPEQPSVTHVNIDHMHIDPAMAEPRKGKHDKQPKDPLLTFPYPVAIVLIYLVAGFAFGLWHPMWILFLTIPFYYWIVNIIVKDPNYQARHGYLDE